MGDAPPAIHRRRYAARDVDREFVLPPEAADDAPAWCVVAEMGDVTLTASLVRRTRELFETIASTRPGTGYDGWQAAVDWDDTLAEEIQGWPDSLE
jgi:hypothetical protein